MKEINTCPVCGAFCNPDTDACLACGEVHHNLLTGGALKPGELAWYTLPIETAEGKRASTLKKPALQDGNMMFKFIPRKIDETTRLFTMVIRDE